MHSSIIVFTFKNLQFDVVAFLLLVVTHCGNTFHTRSN